MCGFIYAFILIAYLVCVFWLACGYMSAYMLISEWVGVRAFLHMSARV